MVGAATFTGRTAGRSYAIGVIVAAGLLVYEHSLVTEDDLSKLDAAFFTMNGIISIAFFLCVLLERLMHPVRSLYAPRFALMRPPGRRRDHWRVGRTVRRSTARAPRRAERDVQLIVSSHGLRLLRTELSIESIDALRERIGARLGSSRARVRRWRSRRSTGVRLCAQCRDGDLSVLDGHAVGDRVGASRSLVERAADVALKERRPLDSRAA
jgi:hypothetical protein